MTIPDLIQAEWEEPRFDRLLPYYGAELEGGQFCPRDFPELRLVEQLSLRDLAALVAWGLGVLV